MQQKKSNDNSVNEVIAVLSRKALQHFKEGRLQQAEDVCQRILSKQQYAGANLILGWIAHQKSEFDVAVECYQQYLGVKSKDAEAHFTLGLALKELGRTEQAIEHYTKSITITANNAAVHRELGDAYTTREHLEEAIEP